MRRFYGHYDAREMIRMGREGAYLFLVLYSRFLDCSVAAPVGMINMLSCFLTSEGEAY
jgi:hypothetical protein